uniref:Uncharacterized protein n=1 Tax=Arundo donax TaxID=35708 RepID=A0A0A9FVR5_ARUDO
MVGRVKQRSFMYNNNSRIAGRYAIQRDIRINSSYLCINICCPETMMHCCIWKIILQYMVNNVLANHACSHGPCHNLSYAL